MHQGDSGYKSILAIDSGVNIGLKRKENQDSILTFLGEDFSLFIVCDGMGGHNSGKLASEISKNAIKGFIVSEFRKYSDYNLLLNDALHDANSKVLETANSNPENSNMGSTAVVLLITKNKAYIAHSGDSRLYTVGINSIKQITKDHSVVQSLLDSGQISAEESKNHPSRNELINVIGLENNFFAEVLPKPMNLRKNDMLLLCSDGLFSLVQDSEIFDIVSQNDFADIVNKLINKALERGGNDNISVIVVKISDVISESNKVHINKNEDVFSVPKLQIEEKSIFEKYKKYILPASAFLGIIALVLLAVFFFKGRNYFDGNLIPDSLINRNLSGTDSKVERILYYLYSGFTLPDTIDFSVTNVSFITKNGRETIDSLKLISYLRKIPVRRIDFEGKAFIDKDINAWMFKVIYDDNQNKLIYAECKIDFIEKPDGIISLITFELLSENKSEELIPTPLTDTLSNKKKENVDSLKNRKSVPDSLKNNESKKDTVKKNAVPGEENKTDTLKKNSNNNIKEKEEKVKEKIKTELKPDSL